MIICRTIAELKQRIQASRKEGRSIGLVPTMGYLHEGHASLLRQSQADNDVTVLSIFVNPMQFGPNEDLDRYPRNEKRDLEIARQCGTSIVFIPSVEQMYPTKPLTSITIQQISESLCGASRPGHFDGVGLVVSKLFHLTAPDRAYFGMKDAQQLAVIQQMVNDLNFDIEIVPCPIVREPDGLALSSRNVYLSAEERHQAVILSQTLEQAAQWIEEPGITVEQLLQKVTAQIQMAKEADIEYAELLTYPSLAMLEPELAIKPAKEPMLLALAVRFGTTRLIDNRLFE